MGFEGSRFKNGPLEIRPARAEDVAALEDRLRDEDRGEIIAAGYPDARSCLSYGLRHSLECSTVLLDGKPVAMFGLNARTLLGAEAMVWLLGTPDMERIKKSFMRWSRIFITVWIGRYPLLWNLVPTKYEKSLKWLRWLGASFGRTVTMGGVDFQLVFFMREN